MHSRGYIAGASILIAAAAAWLLWSNGGFATAPQVPPDAPLVRPQIPLEPGAAVGTDGAGAAAVAPDPDSRRRIEMAMAVSPAQPALTLHGHLTERVNRLPWGDGKLLERTGMSSFDANLIIAARIYNHGAKQPDEQGFRELSALAEEMRQRFGVLGHQEEKLRKEATLRAIAAGNVVSAESGGYDIFDPAAANAHMKANKALGQKLVAEVGARLGELDRDWGYSIMTSTKPDGLGRLNVVYYTRLDEPALFEARDALARFSREQQAAYREFFARL